MRTATIGTFLSALLLVGLAGCSGDGGGLATCEEFTASDSATQSSTIAEIMKSHNLDVEGPTGTIKVEAVKAAMQAFCEIGDRGSTTLESIWNESAAAIEQLLGG
ncbi:MAG: hypothetical protein LBR20_03650 [Propionibacteriaceae bacterium]|jgi:hypothetical protein|nr:hypothetical protein [Propionibacteriaceae bacterium]